MSAFFLLALLLCTTLITIEDVAKCRACKIGEGAPNPLCLLLQQH